MIFENAGLSFLTWAAAPARGSLMDAQWPGAAKTKQASLVDAERLAAPMGGKGLGAV
jgi:hypothetical protein